MKRFIAGAGIVALALVSTGAMGATISGVSDSSTATSIASWLISVMMTNNNNAVITNNVTSTANSGGNTFVSADDQEGTELVTGDANAVTLVENAANNNFVEENYESVDGADNTIEDITDSSTATAASSDTLENEILNNNDVEVENNVDAMADTGSNSVTSGDSLKGTRATTGIAGAATGVSNLFNVNIKEIQRTISSRVRP
ncbi:MAG: hypothetical protein HYW51_01895 [Candidatus Doudnabacteria bacterium]|nr:hypothetical protein [Candidatus Doudnabacteria bacterium]